MSPKVLITLSVLAVATVGSSQGPQRPDLQIAPAPIMPSYQVVRSKVPDDLANRLGVLLRVSGKLGLGDGSIRYFSPKFLALPSKTIEDSTPNEEKKPTRATALLLDELKDFRPFDLEKAEELVLRALTGAQLDVPGSTPKAAHTILEILHKEKEGEPKKHKIDTYVGFSFKLGQLPLIGPGAKMRIALSPDGEATQIRYAYRTVKQGPSVQLISPETADRYVSASMGTSLAYLQKFKKSLVYYAPPIELGTVQTIVPHYMYSGAFEIENKENPKEKEKFQVRDFMIPAVVNAPRAKIDASTQGGSVLARVTVDGGRAPYSFLWCSNGTKSISTQQIFQYSSKGRGGGDHISLIVTDADGLRTLVRAKVAPTAAEGFLASFGENDDDEAAIPTPAIGPIDVGAEYVGYTYADTGQPALWFTGPNAAGFIVSTGLNAIPSQFFWGERDAWETDFKSSTVGGNDTQFSDDVDMTFYTGHANENKFLFSSSRTDTEIRSSDPQWGDRDSEWIVIAACGPLQESNTLNARWGRAFQGLHSVMGYATTSADTPSEGTSLVNYMKGFRFLNIQMLQALPIVISWLATGIDLQNGSVTIGAMGPVRNDGVTNMNDFFWNSGTTGPDIPASRISNFWVLRTGC